MNLKEVMKHCGTDEDLLSATGSSIDSLKWLSLGNVPAFLAEGKAISRYSGQAEEDTAAGNLLILTREGAISCRILCEVCIRHQLINNPFLVATRWLCTDTPLHCVHFLQAPTTCMWMVYVYVGSLTAVTGHRG